MSTVKLSKVLSELPAKDSVADNDNFVLSSYQKLPASQLATAEQLSAAKQTAADGLTSLKSALKGIANTDCARVVIAASGNYAVTTNLDALNDFSTAAGLYALVNAKDYVYGHMLIGSDPMMHGTVQWLIGNWNVEDGKLMVSHSDGCVTIVYRVYLRSDAKWSDWKYYQQNFLKEKADTTNAGEWTYTHTAIEAMKTSLQAAIDSNAANIATNTTAIDAINTDKQKLWGILQDVYERDAEAITNLTTRVEDDETTIATNTTNIATNTANIATNKADIATNAAAIAALDSQVNDTRHHLIVKTTKDLTIAIDGKNVTIPAMKKTEIYFEKSIGNFASDALCHFQLRNTKGLTLYPRLNSKYLTVIDARDWDISAVTGTYAFFMNCSSLRELDVSGWDTSKIATLWGTFMYCSAISDINVSGWDTSSCTNFGATFFGCSGVKSLAVDMWNTAAVDSMWSMFFGCRALATLDLSGWDTSHVTSVQRMFYGCSSLTTLDLTNWDTTNVTTFAEMFSGCSSLANLTLGALFFATKTSTTISFTSLSKWTNATVRTSLVTNLYDRAANGLGTITLQLHANTKAVLSTEDKEHITSKGYIIA